MKGKIKLKLIFYLILGGFLIKIARLVFGFMLKKNKRQKIKDNFKEFFHKEEKEVEELAHGQESFKKYCHDSISIFKDFFVPHDGNGHKPKILRTKSLVTIVVILMILKIAVTGYLFFIYPNQGEMAEQISTEILRLTNEDRAKNNLPPLELNSFLGASALAKAEDMAMRDYFAHHSPDGKKPWDWIDRDSYAYLFVGENLAMNFSSARSAHNALMQSPSHKKNILNSRYREIGLVVISGVINGKRTNILVELFASRKSPALAVETSKIAGSTDDTAVTTNEEGVATLAVEPKEEEKPKPTPPATEVAQKEIEKVEADTTKEQLPPDSEPEQPEASPPEINKLAKENSVATLALTDEEAGRTEETGSPNQELENYPNTELYYYNAANDKRIGIAASLINISKYVFMGILVLLTLALAVNIVVRISIQHKPVIVQTLVIILFIVGLLSARLHILEYIAKQVAVL